MKIMVLPPKINMSVNSFTAPGYCLYILPWCLNKNQYLAPKKYNEPYKFSIWSTNVQFTCPNISKYIYFHYLSCLVISKSFYERAADMVSYNIREIINWTKQGYTYVQLSDISAPGRSLLLRSLHVMFKWLT